ncbi:hypothetical protein Tco_1254136 [Tanacetum coccineum]
MEQLVAELGLLPPYVRYRETPYVAHAILVVPVTHDDPNDPYVTARNAATVPAVDDDGSATLGYTQSSELRGSLRNAQIMPPKAISQAAIERLITQRVNAALDTKRARRENTRGHGSNANRARGQSGAPAARECTFAGFMKCNPTVFHENEGAVELC